MRYIKKKIKNTKQKGFTFVEALVLLFIFSLITVTFYNVISLGTRYILVSKNRLVAMAIANEKMEIIRNLKYEDVGIVGGASCSGNIPQDEDVVRNGKGYHIYTLAEYEDDPYDGTLGGSPNDTAYKDYKNVKVKVSWNNGGEDAGEVTLSSRFAPQGLESASLGDGILSINIFSDQAGGVGVPQSTVHIVNNDVGVNQTIQTDNSGNIMLVGAKESIQGYQLTISKSGYETITTFPSYPNTTYNPVDVHASVIENTLNIINILQNKVADLKIITKDYLGNSVSDIDFNLFGGREIGTEVDTPFNSVYNLNVSEKTNSSGEKEFNSISPGQYIFNLSPLETEYALVGVDLISPFFIVPEDSLELNVEVASRNETSFLVRVINDTDNSIISGAEVNLKSETLSYDQTVETGDDGMAFFPPDSATPFLAGTYELTISKSGFQDHTETIEIVDGVLFEFEEDIIMIST